MAIIDDYSAIAAELRRLRATRPPVETERQASPEDVQPRHSMRRTRAGELLYRRLVRRKLA